MDDYSRLLNLVEDDRVTLAASFKELIGRELVFGQTRWTCRFGTLSDGHEKITPAQRYYQAIKEMYALASNIRLQKALAMEAQADIMDAEERVANAEKPSDKMRAEAKILLAKERLLTSLTTVEDQMRMVDEYNKVRLELQDQVRAQYPLGIEQAEPDNWKAVYEYRMIKQITPGIAAERTDNVPLDPITKAELGQAYGRPDSYAPLIIGNKEAAKIAQGDVQKVIDFVKSKEEPTEDKVELLGS